MSVIVETEVATKRWYWLQVRLCSNGKKVAVKPISNSKWLHRHYYEEMIGGYQNGGSCRSSSSVAGVRSRLCNNGCATTSKPLEAIKKLASIPAAVILVVVSCRSKVVV